MQPSNRDDELITRIAALDPASSAPPITDGALERVARTAMSPAPKTWSWQRYRLASLGALAGSSALVIAAILGMQAAAPELPVLSFASGHHAAEAAGSQTAMSTRAGAPMLMPFFTFHFSTAPGLSSASGSGATYQLTSGEDAQSAAARLAGVFNVAGDVTSPYDGAYQVGPDNGPAVSTWTSSGVVDWSYSSVTTVSGTASPDGSTDTTTTQPDPTLPTDQQAAADALALLSQTGTDASMLGTPQVDSSLGNEVDVSVPLVVGGLATDQSFYVVYGHAGAVQSASGIEAAITVGPTYPTVSPVDGVNILIAHHGFLYYGGVMPLAAGAAATPPTAPDSTSSGAPGASGGSDPSGGGTDTTDTTPTTEVPQPPTVDVEINAATMRLGTYTLADGTTWLLPTWELSGPESGGPITDPQTYTADVVAIAPQYVELQTAPTGL